MKKMEEYSAHPALEFLDEEPTEPVITLSSLVSSAQDLGYDTNHKRHWTERLEEQLEELPTDSTMPIRVEDVLEETYA